MRVALLAPMPSELRPLQRAARALPPGAHVTHRTGVGTAAAADATRRLLDAEAVELVVVVGIAGGVAPRWAIGDLCVPAVVVDEATGAQHEPAPLPGLPAAGRLLTTDRLHTLADAPALLDDGIDALDMETAAVAGVCAERGVAWSVVRAISDRLQDGLVGEDVLAMMKPDGTPDVRAALRLVARRPRRALQLSRLARDSSTAARAAAAAAVRSVSELCAGA